MPLSPEAEARLTAKLRDALTSPLTPEELADGRARWEAARAAQATGAEAAAGPLRGWAASPGSPKRTGAPPPSSAARTSARKKRARKSRAA